MAVPKKKRSLSIRRSRRILSFNYLKGQPFNSFFSSTYEAQTKSSFCDSCPLLNNNQTINLCVNCYIKNFLNTYLKYKLKLKN